MEKVVWHDRGNMLGTGGRLYLDGNLGEMGCEYGVNINTGWWVNLVEFVLERMCVPGLTCTVVMNIFVENAEECRLF